MERGPLAKLRFNPDSPAMALRDLLANGQADACPGIFLLVLQPLEHLENPFPVLFFDTDAIVLDRKMPSVFSTFFAGHMNARRVCIPELDGVGDQVLKHLA